MKTLTAWPPCQPTKPAIGIYYTPKRAIPKPDDIFVLHAAPLDQAHTALHARALQPFPNDLRAQVIQRNADAPVAVAKRRAFADPAPLRATLAGNLRQIVAASAT